MEEDKERLIEELRKDSYRGTFDEVFDRVISPLLKVFAFISGMILVFLEQKNIGIGGLLAEASGILILIFLLWNYNRKYN